MKVFDIVCLIMFRFDEQVINGDNLTWAKRIYAAHACSIQHWFGTIIQHNRLAIQPSIMCQRCAYFASVKLAAPIAMLFAYSKAEQLFTNPRIFTLFPKPAAWLMTSNSTYRENNLQLCSPAVFFMRTGKYNNNTNNDHGYQTFSAIPHKSNTKQKCRRFLCITNNSLQC